MMPLARLSTKPPVYWAYLTLAAHLCKKPPKTAIQKPSNSPAPVWKTPGGVKTSVLYEVRRMQAAGKEIPVADMAASFQAAIVDTLLVKTLQAAREFGVSEILIAGGVSANQALRAAFLGQTEFKVNIPKFAYCTDNAAMIASAGYFRYALGHRSALDIDVMPTWPLS
jgi:N6-L-threonylcarbamoyladenine synthase